MNIENIPKQIPVVPLRQEVLFPGIEIPVVIARSKSINAIMAAQSNNNSYVLVLNQKEDSIELEDPNPSKLYKIGTLCKVTPMGGSSNEFKLQVILLGLYKFKVSSFQEILMTAPSVDRKHLVAEGEVIFDEVDSIDNSVLIKSLESTFNEYERTFPNIENLDMISSSFRRKTEINNLIYLITTILPFENVDKQIILEESKIGQKINLIINRMSSFITNKKMQEVIQKRTMDQLNQMQKEGYLREQMRAIQNELGNDSDKMSQEYIKKITQAKMPLEARKIAEEELQKLESLHQSSAEYNVVKTHLDTLISMPWNNATKDKIDLKNALDTLNEDHFGLDKIKQRIIEYLAVAQMRKSFKGSIICLSGPPGVGKTSLGKSISRSLGRKFARIALGGVRDESEIRGHRKTYVGAMPGKIVSTIKKLGVNNPVILLDEIDKMSKGIQGDPSAAMLEVLDPEQNNSFTDHYLDTPFDLSKVVFICTANVLEEIPGPLRDRMEVIHVGGYTSNEKFFIAKEHLVPKVMKEHGLEKSQLVITDSAIRTIINSYTRESGVRELQRKITAVCRIATKNIVEKKLETISVDSIDVESYLGTSIFDYEKSEERTEPGMATGLAWTSVGGEILSIEANKMKGNGKIILTGSLGDVMKESAQIALSYIRSHAHELGIDENFDKIDIHLHFPAGAIPKDGPSAGITIFTTLVSLFVNKSVMNHLAMTGELSLRGRVLPVGGIKEKVIAAHRSGIKTVILPKANQANIDEIPEEVLKDLNINFVSEIKDVIGIALKQ